MKKCILTATVALTFAVVAKAGLFGFELPDEVKPFLGGDTQAEEAEVTIEKLSDEPLAKLIQEWQEDRVFSSEIKEKLLNKIALTDQDVLISSELKDEQLAETVNAFAPIPATLYRQVVTEVEELSLTQNGRTVYEKIMEKMADGATWNDVAATLTSDETAAYRTYIDAVSKINQDEQIKDIAKPLGKRIMEESKKTAEVIKKVKKDPAFRKQKGFKMAKVAAQVAKDSKNLSEQFSDATKGVTLWLKLLEADKSAKKFAESNPLPTK